MKNIQVIKIGTMVNISIDGRLSKKNCGTQEEAKELFNIVLKAKADPSDENIKAIRMFLNEKTRIAYLTGLETDLETGDVFLAGFNTPIPNALLDVIKDYHENNYPIDAIINFWKLLMINPDTRVRTSLFDFITTHDFVLTDAGYMVVYKAVYYKNDTRVDNSLTEFVSNQYLHVKKDWKCSANKYVVYRELDGGALAMTKTVTADGWGHDKEIEIIGKLGDLYAAQILAENKESADVEYTDMYSRSMRIVLGEPTKMERKDCDGDPANDCSYGNHCGSTKYVERFAKSDSVILACFVNPANVVAVPNYDHSKFRTTEYFPFAVATYENGKIDIVEQKYFESDYCEYEVEELEKLVAKVQNGELPYEKAMEAEEETRPMSELLKVIQERIVDIT